MEFPDNARIEPVRQIDRAYTRARVEWMLENFHALLGVKPMSMEEKAQMSSVVTSNSQWWNSQSYWRKVDRQADLLSGLTFATRNSPRKKLMIQLRYLNDPHDSMTWEEIAAAMGVSRMHAWRLHRQVVDDASWYLGGLSDE
jgi:DNA-directed RNA polymerase sigma subunit (sigma70/sigma32)